MDMYRLSASLFPDMEETMMSTISTISITPPTFSLPCVVKALGQSVWNLTEEQQKLLLPPLDPYDNPHVMSLLEFAKHPIAQELIHNGQTFQVLGITNYSHWGDAGDMRRCVWKDEGSRAHLGEFAVARINKFIHVGTTNRLAESVAAAGVRKLKCGKCGGSLGGRGGARGASLCCLPTVMHSTHFSHCPAGSNGVQARWSRLRRRCEFGERLQCCMGMVAWGTLG